MAFLNSQSFGPQRIASYHEVGPSVKMAPEQCVRLILPCDNNTKVSLLFFTDVTNCSDLKNEAKAGKIDACLLRNALILDEFQVQVAVNMAVNARNQNGMKTRNLFTEIMYFMSCNRNISDALTKFSVQENDTSFLAIVINDDEHNSKVLELQKQVNGQLAPLQTHLKQLSDINAIKKIYKIKIEESEEDLLGSIVSRIATKEVTTV